MPDALNEVFRVNNMMEDVGGLVDPEDLPDEEGGGSDAGRDITNGTQAINDEMDVNDTLEDGTDNTSPAKKTFVTSHPGTDGGSVGTRGGSGTNDVTTRRTRQTSASLAEKLLASISPEAEARQNDNRAVTRLYLQRIRTLEMEVATLRDSLQATTRELNTSERRADKLESDIRMMQMMQTYQDRLSQPSAHRKRHLSPDSDSNSSSSGSDAQPPVQSGSKSRRH